MVVTKIKESLVIARKRRTWDPKSLVPEGTKGTSKIRLDKLNKGCWKDSQKEQMSEQVHDVGHNQRT